MFLNKFTEILLLKENSVKIKFLHIREKLYEMVKPQLDQNVVNLFDVNEKSTFYKVYFDNFLTLMTLLKELRGKGTKAIGTIKALKIHHFKMPKKEKLVQGNINTMFPNKCQASNKRHTIDTQMRISTIL